MRRLIATCAVLTVAATGTLAAGTTGYAAQSQGPTTAKTRTPTEFALKGSGYGSRANGGQVPTGSDTTAYDVIGCTNKAGIVHENHQAEETLPGVGTASEVKTRVWTKKRGQVVSSISRNTINRVEMTDSPLGTLEINNIVSRSRAYHDGSAFKVATRSSIGSISFTPPGGPAQSYDAPTPGQPVEIPGVATLTVGSTGHKVTAHRASVQTDALKIVSTMSGTRTRIAHTAAQIHDGLITGVFGGWASGTRGNSADGNITSGKSPHQVMPCQGTAGKTWSKAIDSTDLSGNLLASGLRTKERGTQNQKRAWGFEQAQVAGVNLGGGQLTVDGIIGRVNVSRPAHGRLHRNIKGTTIGTITANGEEQTFPDTDVLEIPGVARLERNIVKKIKSGLWVTSLRITLLDGTGAVYNFGEAKLRIRSSGR